MSTATISTANSTLSSNLNNNKSDQKAKTKFVMRGQSLTGDAIKRLRKDKVGFISFIVIVAYLILAALCATGVIFTNFAVDNSSQSYLSPSLAHPLGTDIFGRDVLARAAQGTVTSLIIGFLGAGLSVVIGTFLGAVSGYFGGIWDDIIVWLYSTLDTIPYILLLAGLSFVLGAGIETLCIAIGLTSWVSLCRLIRGEFIKHREREYVQAANALGASHMRRMIIHILPNTLHLVLINFSLGFVSAIKSEVILSYLGLGVVPGTPSWGMMISDAKQELVRGIWWNLTAATVFMFFLVLAFNLFNDALRDALDPKLKNK